MEDAINSVIFFPNQIISRYIENNKPLQLFQLNDFFNLINKIIAQVQLHKCLHIIKARKSLDLVIFKTQLGQAFKLIDICYPLNLILPKVQFLKILQMQYVLDGFDFILFKT